MYVDSRNAVERIENWIKEIHSAVVVLGGFPVSIGHGELVEISEERSDHGIGGAINRGGGHWIVLEKG